MIDPFENRAAGGIKSIQRGVIGGSGSFVQIAISPVDPAKSELRYLGFSTSGTTPSIYLRRISLTNATTITMESAGSGGEHTVVSWELTTWK